MKNFIFLVLLLISSSVVAQLKFFIDIPKVDGERIPVVSRQTLTKAPKEKCTNISSFSFSSSKSIYIGSNLNIQKNTKPEDFQPIQIILPLDKSITEWHDRAFKGTALPTLDVFVDKQSNVLSELIHLKIFNVKVKDLSFSQSPGAATYSLTLSYDKIIYASSKLNLNGTINSVTQTCFDIKNGIACSETL